MNRLTFPVFWKWFADDFSPTRTVSEHFVFQKLFEAYYSKTDENVISESMLSSIKMGKEKLPKKMINAYCTGNEYTDALEAAVKKYIMENVRCWPAAGEALCAIIDNDPTIGLSAYRELKECCNLEGHDETAAWLTKVLVCAMDPRELPEVANKLRMVSITYTPKPCDWFVGRDDEVGAIHDKLKDCQKVFLQGIPGIGKSELAKKYVAEHGKEYLEILWIPCRDSLRKSIAAVELERDRMEDDGQTRFQNHIHMLKHLPEGALAVLDNCNWLPEDEPLLDEIMGYRCHVLVTTRTCVADRVDLEVKELPEEALLELMKRLCKKKDYSDRELMRLIRKLHQHTFSVELAARIVANKLTPWELLVKLNLSRFTRNTFKKKVTSRKDNTTKRASYYQTMSELFLLLDLDRDKQEVLCNMTLMPDDGVYLDDLLMLLGLRDEETVETLKRMGLLRWDEDADVVQMLPLVREIALEDVYPSIRKCNGLVDRVIQMMSEYGADDPCLPLLGIIVERIAEEAEKDDPDRYWALMCNAINAMEGIGQKAAMKRILSYMERFLRTYSMSAAKTAEYLDLKACFVDDNQKKVLLEENALHILEQAGAGDSELARNICNNLAGAYRQMYQYEKAVAMLEERLTQITQEEQNPQQHDYLACVCNLAMTYAEMGDSEKALGLVTPVERELHEKKNCGSEYAMVLETLGHIHMMSGRISLAIDRYEQGLSVWTDLLGWQSQVTQEKASEFSQLIRRSYRMPQGRLNE